VPQCTACDGGGCFRGISPVVACRVRFGVAPVRRDARCIIGALACEQLPIAGAASATGATGRQGVPCLLGRRRSTDSRTLDRRANVRARRVRHRGGASSERRRRANSPMLTSPAADSLVVWPHARRTECAGSPKVRVKHTSRPEGGTRCTRPAVTLAPGVQISVLQRLRLLRPGSQRRPRELSGRTGKAAQIGMLADLPAGELDAPSTFESTVAADHTPRSFRRHVCWEFCSSASLNPRVRGSSSSPWRPVLTCDDS